MASHRKCVDETVHKLFSAIVVVPDGFVIPSPNDAARLESDGESSIGASSDAWVLSETTKGFHETDDAVVPESQARSSDCSKDQSEDNTDSRMSSVPLCCLTLPVGRTSLLIANLRALRKSGVKDLAVLVTQANAAHVQAHLQAAGGRKYRATPIISVTKTTLLEAFREARYGELRTMQNDFFLVMADTFFQDAETQLIQLCQAHQAATASDPTRLLTRLVAEVPKVEDSASKDGDVSAIRQFFLAEHPFPNQIYVVNAFNGQLLHAASDRQKQSSHLVISSNMLAQDPKLTSLRLVPSAVMSGVDLFSNKLFNLIDDEFDLLHIVPDLLDNVLNDDLRLRTIGAYIPQAQSSPTAYPCAFRATTFDHLYLVQKALSEMGNLPSAWTLKDDEPSSECSITPSVSRNFIGRDVVIGSDVVVENCLIFDGVSLGDKCSCRYSVLLPGCSVPFQTQLDHVTVEHNVSANDFPSSKAEHTVISRGCLTNAPLSMHYGVDITRPKQSSYEINTVTAEEFLADGDGASDRIYSRLDSDDDEDALNDWTDAKCPSDIVSSVNGVENEPQQRVLVATSSPHPDTASRTDFSSEVYTLSLEALRQPSLLGHKLLEIKSFRLACHERMEACIEPCARALFDFLACHYGSCVALTADALEGCRADELLDGTAMVSSEEGQQSLLQVLFANASSRETISAVDGPDCESEDCDEAHNSKSAPSIPNPFFEPSLFCRLLGVLRELDVLDDTVLITWCDSVPSDSAYAPYLRSFAKALAHHNQSVCA